MIADSTNRRRSVLRMTDKRNLATLPLSGAQSKRIDAKAPARRCRRSPDHVGTGGPAWGIEPTGTA
jgi:hypothetical protein